MFSDTYKYVLDANAIRCLSYDQICSKKRNDRMIVTIEDVKHEVASLKKLDAVIIESLNQDAFRIMGEIINKFQSVRDIVDYYGAKATADVGLLSYSLSSNDGRLYEDKVVIVTDDNGLRNACNEIGVDWISVDDFNNL